jgi:hypothetical protein
VGSSFEGRGGVWWTGIYRNGRQHRSARLKTGSPRYLLRQLESDIAKA